MDERNQHNESFYGDKLPVNIPSADDAWKDMRRRLKRERRRRSPWWVVTFLTLSLLTLIFFVVSILMHPPNNINSTTQNIVSVKKIDTNRGTDVPSAYLQSKNEKQADRTGDAKTVRDKGPAQNNVFAGVTPQNIFQHRQPVQSYGKRKVSGITSRPREYNSGANEVSIIPGLGVDSTTVQQLRGDGPTDRIPGKIADKDSTASDANKKPPIKKKHLTTDSLGESDNSEKEDDKNDFTTDAGLQWNAPLPFTNAASFFSGPDGSSQPYRLLLPGVWISLHSKRSLLSFEINPFSMAHITNKPYKISTFSSTASDTSTTTSDTKILNKLFGFSAGLGYAYNVAGSWWLGGNLQAIWWSRGLATSRIDINKQSVSGSFNTIDTHSYKKYELGSGDWENFEKFQMKVSAEILFRKKMWQAGMHAGLPVMPFARSTGPSNPFSAEVFFRLQLLTDNKN